MLAMYSKFLSAKLLRLLRLLLRLEARDISKHLLNIRSVTQRVSSL